MKARHVVGAATVRTRARLGPRSSFPAVSLEGRTLWLLRSSPLMLQR
ncbi:MAG: hypothetical protein ACOCVZ_07860 [Gemmatimonadota bacterium]